jgi:Zn-finger nucleic acid-binding protein
VSYRAAALSCPVCTEPLDETESAGATIDVCATCGGVWVDWFDGELIAILRAAPAAAPLPPPAESGAKTRGAESGGGCPRCRSPLSHERYWDSEAEILRCADCAGAFVSRDAARIIAGLDPEPTRPPSDPLSLLAAALRRWFGWDEPVR